MFGKVKRKPSNCESLGLSDSNPSAPGVGELDGVHITARVRFNYTPEREDELSLIKNTRVTVLEKCSDGWWRGISGSQNGWFPSNYVVEEASESLTLGRQDPVQRSPLSSPRHDACSSLPRSPVFGTSGSSGSTLCAVLHRVQALYHFTCSSEEELSFSKGEIMEVLEKPENDPEWWRCRKTDGRLGFVPRNYVQVLGSGRASPTPQPIRMGLSPVSSGKFAGQPWYYGAITRQQAEAVLNERGSDGDFLVRDSESSPTDFSISLKATGKNKHFKNLDRHSSHRWKAQAQALRMGSPLAHHFQQNLDHCKRFEECERWDFLLWFLFFCVLPVCLLCQQAKEDSMTGLYCKAIIMPCCSGYLPLRVCLPFLAMYAHPHVCFLVFIVLSASLSHTLVIGRHD
uniref:NCK adaptor protein 1a n=1 Tax=Eptatretus burgeri TaxID=7764 RepID=A0A8C4QX05_EPTBU